MSYCQDFFDYILVRKRYSKRTLALYQRAITRFYAYMYPEEHIQDIKEFELAHAEEFISLLNIQNIRGFIANMLDENYNPESINLDLSALSTFCLYLVKIDVLKSNPLSGIVRPKQKRRLPKFYSQEKLNNFLDQSVEDNFISVRNLLIISLIFYTGMRRAEVAALRIADIDSERSVFKILGKGNKEREIPIVAPLMERIEDYMELRKKILFQFRNSEERGFREPETLIVTNKGREAYVELINRVVKGELSVDKNFSGKRTPHVLRHSFATALLNNGADLNSIKEVLGHSSLAATEVYTHNSFEQLRKIYAKAHPHSLSDKDSHSNLNFSTNSDSQTEEK